MKKTLSLGLLAFTTVALGAPPEPLDKPLIPRLTGQVILSNCQAAVGDVRLVIRPINRTVAPTSRTVLSDGRVKMAFSTVLPGALETSLTVTPTMRSGVCGGGSFSPRTANVEVPGSVQFQYAVAPGDVRRIPARDFASTLGLFLRAMKMKLNNQGTQSSFVELIGNRLPFEIPRVTVDIDCGTFCPDLGDGHFYVNDVNLKDTSFEFANNSFVLTTEFEDQGREIKGYHNKLGDNGMPDFELSRIKLSLKATAKVLSGGRLGFGFHTPRLDAGISATGGCSIAGIDICNKIFGTDRKIQKGVEQAAVSALNGNLVQQAIASALAQYLDRLGVQGPIVGVRLEGGDLVISTR